MTKPDEIIRIQAIGPIRLSHPTTMHFMQLQVSGRKVTFLRHSFAKREIAAKVSKDRAFLLAQRKKFIQYTGTLDLKETSEWKAFVDFLAELCNIDVPGDFPAEFYEPLIATTWNIEKVRA